jgi:glycosyltransferase involved in cell wall biosynthesis
MQLVLVNKGIHYRGGVERVFAEMLKYLVSHGWQVEVVCAEIDDELAALCSRVQYVPWRPGPGRLGMLAETWRWMRAIGKVLKQPDYLRAVVFAAPTVCWRPSAVMAGSCHLAAMLSQSKSGNHRWLLNPLHWLYFLSELLPYHCSAKAIMVPSQRTKGEIQRCYKVPARKLHVIPHGVDSASFAVPMSKTEARRQLDLATDQAVLLTVTNEVERKGCYQTLQALHVLKQQGYHFTYIVAGRDDYQGLRDEVARLDLGDAVRLLGGQGGAELSRLYAAADMFVLPTLYESFGLVCMEAMAAGVPVIATQVGGIEDYLKPGENGLFTLRDPQSIAQNIRQLLDQPSLRQHLAQGALASAQQHDWQQVLGPLPAMLHGARR